MKALIPLLGLALAATAANAFAAGTATYRLGADSQLTYAWRGEALRVDMSAQQEGYMLARDGHIYMVTNSGGQPMVMDLSGMNKAFAGALPAGSEVESYDLVATGESETVAGIAGELYLAKVTYADGTQAQGELVLTDHPLVAEMSTALSAMGQSMLGKDNPMTAQLTARGQGMLRYSDKDGSLVLTRISPDAPPASAFTLPAKPMQMPNFGALAAGAAAGTQTGAGGARTTAAAEGDDGGGLFGGLFGGGDDPDQGVVDEKVERQKDRQASHVEQRVDEEADSAVDKAVEGVLDSLFD